VSATDDERLPPGGFSLRHGFPRWFGRASKVSNSRVTSGQHLQTPVKSPGGSITGTDTPDSIGGGAGATSPIAPLGREPQVSTFEVLKYIRSTFDDAEVLDGVPLEAAGNPGAWHAWRTHRAQALSTSTLKDAPGITTWHEGLSDDEGKDDKADKAVKGAVVSSPTAVRKPGEWNWDGVWEVRSRKGIEGSLAEPVLYGNIASSDDLVCGLPYLLLGRLLTR
jgi:hypothetical protein